MGHLFLDIETYVSPHDNDSALNPYHRDSKVLVVTYNYYEGFKPPVKSEIKEPIFLKEWELGEKALLTKFMEVLRELHRKDPYLKIHGFNILRFDLPYLFGRMKFHEVAGDEEIYSLLYKPFGTDMMQLASLISNESRAKEQLWGLNQKDVNRFFNIQIKEGSGLDVSRFYDNREYDKILEYCNQEFTFEQLLNSFYLYARLLRDGQV
jgi:hypothetical protein